MGLANKIELKNLVTGGTIFLEESHARKLVAYSKWFELVESAAPKLPKKSKKKDADRKSKTGD